MFKRKRYLKMLMSLLLTAFVAPPVQAETLTVADGTVQNNYVPISGNNTTNNRYVEVIYPSTMLEDLNGGLINAVKFYCKSNDYLYNKKYTIEVGESTTQSSFGDAINSGLTVVATDVNLAAGITEFEINFTTPYNYHGGNLVVKLTQTAAGITDKSVFYGITQAGAAYTSWPVSNTYVQNFMPKTTFTYEPGTLAKYDAKVSPSSLSFGSVQVDASGELSVALKNKGTNALTYTVSGLEAPFSTTVASGTLAAGADDLSIPVTFTPTAAGAFEDDLVISFGSETGLDPITVHVTGTGSDAICDGGATNQYLPVYGYYFDEPQLNQMVYPASKIYSKLNGKSITGLTFYPATDGSTSGINFYKNSNDGTVTIKLKNLDGGTEPYASTPVRIEGATPVKTITMPTSAQTSLTEWVFEFDEAFDYTGGDLLIEVETTKGGYGRSYFYGEDQSTTYTSYYSYGNGAGTRQPFLPKVTFAVEAAVPQVKVTPAELSFGGEDFVCGNGNTDTKTFKVTNTTAENVSLTLNDESGFFSINPTTAIEAGTNATIEVTYAPTAAGTHTATVTVGDKTVTLTGTAIAPVISGTVTPTELTFSCVEGKTATGTITIANTGNTAFTPEFTVEFTVAAPSPFSIEEATEKIAVGESKDFIVTYAPTAVGNDKGTLTVAIGTQEPIIVALNGTAKEIGSELLVCDGEATSYVAPVYGYFYDTQDSKTQFIYPAEDLKDLVGRKITSVKFFPKTSIGINAGKLQLLMKETEQTTFSRSGYSGPADDMIEDMKVVATIVDPLSNDEELKFEFDEPILYKGGNLAFETYVLEKGNYAYKSYVYYGVEKDGYTACYANSSENGLEEFLPKAFFESDAAPATEIATLRDLCLAADGKYTIQEELLGVYMQDKSVWFKDENGSAIDFQTPGAEKVYWINDVSTKDFDQSNWIEVDFSNVEIPEAVTGQEPNVKIQNLTGIFTNENGNPKLVLTETPAEVTALTTNDKPYEPNVYIPAHFEGTHQGYFFSYPKAQEYAKFIKAQWDGSNMVMTSDTEYNPEGLTGSFTIKPVDGLDEHVGQYYEFHGIVRGKVSASSSPRLKAEGDEGYDVIPTDLVAANGTVTAINAIGINGNVKSVKYVNVAGVVSDRPFEGVNIVVTEYTDGSRTTVKMVR